MRFTQNAKKMSNAIQFKITKYITWSRESAREREGEGSDTVSDGL